MGQWVQILKISGRNQIIGMKLTACSLALSTEFQARKHYSGKTFFGRSCRECNVRLTPGELHCNGMITVES